MPTLKPLLHATPVALAALVLVAGCDRPKPRQDMHATGPLNSANPSPVASPAAPNLPATTDPLPPTPDWAKAYMGKSLKDVLPTESADCVGNTDDVDMHYAGTATGVRVEGWGWDKAAKKPVEHILLVDEKTGEVVGAGQTGKARPDVTRARPDVTSSTTGWEAVTARTVGGLYAWGLVGGGKAVCRLGHINL